MEHKDITDNPFYKLSEVAAQIIDACGENEKMKGYLYKIYEDKLKASQEPPSEKERKISLIQKIRNTIIKQPAKNSVNPKHLTKTQEKLPWQAVNADCRLKRKRGFDTQLAEELNGSINFIVESKELKTLGSTESFEEIRDKAWENASNELNNHITNHDKKEKESR